MLLRNGKMNFQKLYHVSEKEAEQLDLPFLRDVQERELEHHRREKQMNRKLTINEVNTKKEKKENHKR